jgi:hypothetical protein
MFKVRASRILSFEGSGTNGAKDPSLRSGQPCALNYCCLSGVSWIQDFTHGNKAYAGNDSRNVIAK